MKHFKENFNYTPTSPEDEFYSPIGEKCKKFSLSWTSTAIRALKELSPQAFCSFSLFSPHFMHIYASRSLFSCWFSWFLRLATRHQLQFRSRCQRRRGCCKLASIQIFPCIYLIFFSLLESSGNSIKSNPWSHFPQSYWYQGIFWRRGRLSEPSFSQISSWQLPNRRRLANHSRSRKFSHLFCVILFLLPSSLSIHQNLLLFICIQCLKVKMLRNYYRLEKFEEFLCFQF